jgi:hypothetical protein
MQNKIAHFLHLLPDPHYSIFKVADKIFERLCMNIIKKQVGKQTNLKPME